MRHRFPAILFLFLLFALACSSSTTTQPASTPPSPTPAAAIAPAPAPAPAPVNRADAATVYIYRPKAFMGFALRPTVLLDGKDLVNIGNGKLYTGYFTPGTYKFEMDDKKSGAKLDLKSGEAYYMRVEIVPGFWKGGGRMTLMDPRQGSTEIEGLEPVPPTEIEDKTHS